MRVCMIDGCNSKHKGYGYCSTHYDRWRNGRDIGGAERVKLYGASVEERLRRRGWSVTDSGCWEWNGVRDPNGYGRFDVTGRRAQVLAHRAAYETWVGPIPDGACVMHKCDNPPCINPDHLTPGTHLENMQDMVRKGRARNSNGVLKSHCKRGHPFSVENTIYDGGYRRCRRCKYASIARYQARKAWSPTEKAGQ